MAAAVLLAVSTAQGATIFVDAGNCPGPGDGSVGDPYCSIQTAIDNAVDTDEVVVAPGTYFETIDFNGKAIWLHSSGGPEVTTIDGTGNYHVVLCWSLEESDTVLEGFTITGGNASGAGYDGFGAGMINSSSSPTVTDCTFIGNTATDSGGGMVNFSSSPTVTNCTFDANTADDVGGGMFNFTSSLTVTNCTFSGNSADFGGGMFNDNASSPTVTNCTFSGNTAGRNGGGMYNMYSSPTVTNCTFSGNAAEVGGGMYNVFDSGPTVTNCTFSGNMAKFGGGGILGGGEVPATVTNCVLWGDTPDEISGVATVQFSNVQGGFPGTGNIDAYPMFVDAGSNCCIPYGGLGCEDSGCEVLVCEFFPACCSVVWEQICADVASILCADLCPALPEDVRLRPGSPCIDAGDNTAVPGDITTDLDGNPRFVDDPDTPDSGNGDPPIVDMGAYEFQGLPCPWDLDGDGNVFITDLLLLLMDFGNCGGSPADFDGDGCVTVVDLLTLLGNWGPCPGTPCVWDVNGDGTVDPTDLRLVLGNFGPCDGCPEDVNGDGVVNGQDAAEVATHFGPCP